MVRRCAWVTDDSIYMKYHDEEWGRPLFDDRRLFEFLLLEGAQAGLSWITILKKREAYRELFDQFDASIIAQYDDAKINQLLQDARIIRNRKKIEAAISNAKAFLSIQNEFGSFSEFIWKFVGGQPIINQWRHISQVPAYTKESKQMSSELKRRGFQFVGPTICYSFMQATGMVHDHTTDCFCYGKIT